LFHATPTLCCFCCMSALARLSPQSLHVSNPAVQRLSGYSVPQMRHIAMGATH
jgi:hypothetical protein